MLNNVKDVLDMMLKEGENHEDLTVPMLVIATVDKRAIPAGQH